MDQSIYCPLNPLPYNSEFGQYCERWLLKNIVGKGENAVVFVCVYSKFQMFIMDQSIYCTLNPLPYNSKFERHCERWLLKNIVGKGENAMLMYMYVVNVKFLF